MYEENGAETVILARNPDGQEFRISVDAETQARMLNDGWVILEEEREFFREPTVDPSPKAERPTP